MVNALRENVTEQLNVYIYGASPAAFQEHVQRLRTVFDQPQFVVDKSMVNPNLTTTTWRWYCYSSDYSLSTQREFLHANMGVMNVQLLRRPERPEDVTTV